MDMYVKEFQRFAADEASHNSICTDYLLISASQAAVNSVLIKQCHHLRRQSAILESVRDCITGDLPLGQLPAASESRLRKHRLFLEEALRIIGMEGSESPHRAVLEFLRNTTAFLRKSGLECDITHLHRRKWS
jgi:hypothetical protein